MRIGVVQELMGGHGLRLDDRSRDAVSAAADVFRELGAEVIPVSLPMAPLTGPIVRTITSTERVSLNPEWLRERFEDYHPNTRVAFATGNLIPGQVYYKALKLRALVRRQVIAAFQDVDLLIQPTSTGPAGLLSDEPAVVSSKEMAAARVAGREFPRSVQSQRLSRVEHILRFHWRRRWRFAAGAANSRPAPGRSRHIPRRLRL